MKKQSIPLIEGKNNAEKALERIKAWYHQQIVDRAPIRFSAHNSEYAVVHKPSDRWPTLKDRWFDAEYQVDSYLASIRGQKFLAETFPVFWPNLGPEVYSAFYGGELTYAEVTAYSVPLLNDLDRDLDKIHFDENNPYLRKLDEMTELYSRA